MNLRTLDGNLNPKYYNFSRHRTFYYPKLVLGIESHKYPSTATLEYLVFLTIQTEELWENKNTSPSKEWLIVGEVLDTN